VNALGLLEGGGGGNFRVDELKGERLGAFLLIAVWISAADFLDGATPKVFEAVLVLLLIGVALRLRTGIPLFLFTWASDASDDVADTDIDAGGGRIVS
jgi:hypothetical protein